MQDTDTRLSERETCARIVRNHAHNVTSDCDDRGIADPETGEVDCAREARGGTCVCAEIIEFADAAASRILMKTV